MKRRNPILFFCVALLLIVPLLPTGRASAGPQGKLVYSVAVDLVRGSFQPLGPVCVQTSVFKQGEEVVWRVRVLDVASGEDPGEGGKNPVALEERGMKVTVYLENGVSFPMRYGSHPGRPGPGVAAVWFWSVAWKIPADYPTGSLRWWVVVQDKTGAFVRFDPIGGGTNLPGARIVVERGP